VRLYVFTSNDLTNIWAGVGAQMWAVPNSNSESSNKGRATKALKMPVGAFGILYCTEKKSFTCPFVVHSKVDQNRVVNDVWAGQWILPFKIRTIGDPHALLKWEEAKKLLPSCAGNKKLNELLHVEPLTVFTADEISEADWSILVEKLAN
jgi:hypothetical protein